MAVTASFYNLYKQKILSGANAVDWDADTLKVVLLTASYTPNIDTHDFYDDLTNELTTTGGYTAGGVTLTTVSTGLNTGSDFAYADADDVTWTALTATFRYAVILKSTGTPGTSPLIILIDFGSNQSPAGVDFVLQWAAVASGGVAKVA